MKRILGLLWVLILCTQIVFAQEEGKASEHKIDSAMAISPAYMPVYYAKLPGTFFMPMTYQAIDTTIFYTSEYDQLLKTANLYQTLGINGQAHQSMVYDYRNDIGFSMITLPFPLYFKKQEDLKYYDVKTSYTELAYTYGITAENNFHATHAQKFNHVNFVGNLFGYSNKGYFLRQQTNMISLDFILHYQTKRDIYGFTCSYILNQGKFNENGGLSDYHTFADRIAHDTNAVRDLGSFNVVFKDAASQINRHDVLFQQYVNIKDKKDHYYGTISHSFQFNTLKSTFTDQNLNNDFYRDRYYLSTDSTKDTLQYYSIVNTLQWSNYEPLSRQSEKNYFFRIAGGIRHEFVNTKTPRYIGNTYSLFARTQIRLFKVWDIYGSIAYTFNKYNQNDAIANVAATFALKRNWKQFIGLSADFYRVSPDFIYSYYLGNNNSWECHWQKENNLKLSAFYTIFDYKLRFNYFRLNKHVYFNDEFVPVQSEKSISVVQLNLFAPVRINNFKMDINLSLQHSSKPYVSVPLFTGKLYAAYCFRIFKNKLKIHVGGDLMYNTLYYADAYNPLLHQFYHQEKTKVGNYLYFDANITFQVQRIAFFFRAGNIIAGAFGYKYFTTPYYPMQGQNFELGITWKFYD